MDVRFMRRPRHDLFLQPPHLRLRPAAALRVVMAQHVERAVDGQADHLLCGIDAGGGGLPQRLLQADVDVAHRRLALVVERERDDVRHAGMAEEPVVHVDDAGVIHQRHGHLGVADPAVAQRGPDRLCHQALQQRRLRHGRRRRCGRRRLAGERGTAAGQPAERRREADLHRVGHQPRVSGATGSRSGSVGRVG
jgi:hypothetical protein